MTTTEDLDLELARLAGLAKDCNGNARRKEIVWARIDRLLEERGKLSMEVFCEDSSLQVQPPQVFQEGNPHDNCHPRV